MRQQLAYAFGDTSSETAAVALAKLAAASDDVYLRAAVLSSLHAGNVNEFRQALPASVADSFDEPLLEMAARMNDGKFIQHHVGDLITVNWQEEQPSNSQLRRLAKALLLLRQRSVELTRSQMGMLGCLGAKLSIYALHTDEPIERRRLVIDILSCCGEGVFDEEMLMLMDPSEPVEVQLSVARHMATRLPKDFIGLISAASPKVRAEITGRLLSRESTALMLLGALAEEMIPVHAIALSDRQKMQSHSSLKVQQQAKEVFGKSSSQSRSNVLRQYKSVTGIGGDIAKGQAVFKKNCSACHRAKEVGNAVGPDLAAIKNRSPNAMLTAILDPNAAVEDKFLSYNLLLEDGESITGIISDESGNSLQIKTPKGETVSVVRSDIEAMKGTGKSMMPEGLEEAVSKIDMKHLLSFLDTLAAPAKTFDGNVPELVTATKSGTIELSANRCRIYGDQIRFEKKYDNVGFWGSPNDRVTWTLEVPKQGRYEVWIHYACPDGIAGNEFHFTCGDQTLSGTVQTTGTWDKYQEFKVGTIQFPQARLSASLAADPKLRRFLFDLKQVVLKPIP